MGSIQAYFSFLRDIKNDKVDFQDVTSVHCARLMAKWRLWFTEDDYNRASLTDVFLNNIMTHVSFLFIASAALYQVVHSPEIPLDVVLLKITHLMMLFIGFNMIYIGRMYRREFSELIRFVNFKSLEILKREDSLKFRPIRNRIYIITASIMIAMSTGAMLTPVPYLLETLSTGELYFNTILPLDNTPYSVAVYLQLAGQLITIYWMLSYGILFLVVIFEPTLRLATSYRVIAADLRTLRNGEHFTEEGEFQRLRSLMMECNEIKEYIDKTNVCSSQFFLRFIFMSFTLVGVLLAVFIKFDRSWENVLYLGYPCNAYAMTAIVCFLGEHLLEAANEMEVAIYDCDWYSAPIAFRKMVLMFLIRCHKPTLVHAKPFYELNLAQLTNITKSIYVMITIARELF